MGAVGVAIEISGSPATKVWPPMHAEVLSAMYVDRSNDQGR